MRTLDREMNEEVRELTAEETQIVAGGILIGLLRLVDPVALNPQPLPP
jgi:hypothetical protein